MCDATPGENCRYPDGSDAGAEMSHRLRVFFFAYAQRNAPPIVEDDPEIDLAWVQDVTEFAASPRT